MELPLKQHMCNDCCKLSDILDCAQKLPKGMVGAITHTHYCDRCASKHEHEDNRKQEE